MSSILSQNTPNKASGGAGGYKSVYGDSLPAVSSPAWPQTPTHQQSIPPRAAPGSKTQQSLTQSQISAQVSKPRPIAAPKPYKVSSAYC